MTPFEIEDQGGKWALKGDVTLYALSQAKAMLKTPKPHSDKWSIDCSAVTQMDTAGIAYLLECIRYAQHQDLKLKILKLPKAVKPLMEAQGVAQIIGQYVA